MKAEGGPAREASTFALDEGPGAGGIARAVNNEASDLRQRLRGSTGATRRRLYMDGDVLGGRSLEHVVVEFTPKFDPAGFICQCGLGNRSEAKKKRRSSHKGTTPRPGTHTRPVVTQHDRNADYS
jgi:hypothetical protein